MWQFNICKSMLEYLTDNDLSLNAKGLLSIILFQNEIENLCYDDKETIKDALLKLRISKYIKYDSETEKLIAAPTPFKENYEQYC